MSKKKNEIVEEVTVEEEIDMNDPSLFEFQRADDSASEHISAPKYSYWGSVFRRFFSNKVAIIMLVIATVTVLFAFIQPIFSQYNAMYTPFINDKSMHYVRPFVKSGYLFGTDDQGRNLFDALWSGTKNSLIIAISATLVTEFIGIVVGMFWGFSKKMDIIMIEIYNVVTNVPFILVISVMVMIFSATFWTMVFAMTITGWLMIAYFIRTQVIIIRDREYNMASRCLGTSTFKIAIKNILPFMVSVIMTILATEIPSYISYEVFLSYIGMGLSEMSLGRLIFQAESAMVTPGWGFEFWSPVVVASIIAVVLYVVGQNLGDASDPRTHM